MDNQFIEACKRGHINKANELYLSQNIDLYTLFSQCCFDGDIDTAKLLLDLFGNNININLHDDYIFRQCCEFGCVNSVKWLLSLPDNNININVYNDAAFRASCANGYIEIVRLLLDLQNNKININAIDDYAFQYSCEGGHIQIAKLLLDTPGNRIDLNKICILFRESCFKGKLETAEFLFGLGNNCLGLNANNDFIFRYSCRVGHMDIVKWLLNLPNNKININVFHDEAFRSCCMGGYLELAKFLMGVPNNKINVNALNDSAFKESCYKGHVNVVQWLVNLPDNKIDLSFIERQLYCCINQDKIVRVILETGKISNKSLNTILANNKVLRDDGSLVSYIFSMCYYPMNKDVMKVYTGYKTKMVGELKIMSGMYLIKDIWDLVYGYLFM